MKRLFIVYIFLIALTILSAYAAANSLGGAWFAVAAIMAMGFIKFSLVVLEYMEMRKANRAWKLGVILPAVVVALLVGIFAAA